MTIRSRQSRDARLLLALAVVLLAACSQQSAPVAGPSPAGTPVVSGPPTPAPSIAEGGVFYSYIRRPSFIDPGRAVEAEDLAVVAQLYDSLTAVGRDLAVVPAVAERWESNENSTVFTFYLRDDATFHDGRPVTATDFKRAWDRIAGSERQPPPAAFYLLSSVEGFEQAQERGQLSGVEVVDERRLLVRLTQPMSIFPAMVSHPGLAPVPEEATSATNDYGRMPIGNGPLRMTEPWEPSGFIRLEPYEDHPGQTPAVDQIVYRSYQGTDAAASAYQDFVDTNLDFAPVPEGRLQAAIDRYGAASGYSGSGVLRGGKLITAFYAFNTELAPFNDPRVRRALSLLVNREAIVEEVVGGTRSPASSVVPTTDWAYQSARCGFCSFDPERARRILGDLDIGPIELFFYEEAGHETVARRVQRDVNAALGEDTLRLRPMSQDRWLRAVGDGKAGFFLYGWLAEYPSPDSFLYPLFHQSRVGSDNVTRYRSQRVTDLLNQARRTKNTSARHDLYREAESLVLRDMPVVPLFHYRLSSVVADRVHNLYMTPLGYPDLTDLRVETDS